MITGRGRANTPKERQGYDDFKAISEAIPCMYQTLSFFHMRMVGVIEKGKDAKKV